MKTNIQIEIGDLIKINKDHIFLIQQVEQIRRFENTSNKHSKFWSFFIKNGNLIVAWGKIGFLSQIKEYPINSYLKSLNEAEKKIGNKLRNGYIEIKPPNDELICFSCMYLGNSLNNKIEYHTKKFIEEQVKKRNWELLKKE